MDSMTSNKPYMIRATHEWILDNNCTPYIVFMADYPGVQVPVEFIRDGQITLNVAPSAVKDLVIDSDSISFNARFGGVPSQIYGPIGAVVAIFAKENGQGMGFDVEASPEPPEGGDVSSVATSKRPLLKVVK